MWFRRYLNRRAIIASAGRKSTERRARNDANQSLSTWAISASAPILAMIFDYLPAERSLAGAFANLPPMGLWTCLMQLSAPRGYSESSSQSDADLYVIDPPRDRSFRSPVSWVVFSSTGYSHR